MAIFLCLNGSPCTAIASAVTVTAAALIDLKIHLSMGRRGKHEINIYIRNKVLGDLITDLYQKEGGRHWAVIFSTFFKPNPTKRPKDIMSQKIQWIAHKLIVEQFSFGRVMKLYAFFIKYYLHHGVRICNAW